MSPKTKHPLICQENFSINDIYLTTIDIQLLPPTTKQKLSHMWLSMRDISHIFTSIIYAYINETIHFSSTISTQVCWILHIIKRKTWIASTSYKKLEHSIFHISTLNHVKENPTSKLSYRLLLEYTSHPPKI